MYILNWLWSCAAVSSLASSAPVWKTMPAASSQDRTAWASASGTVAISATSALCDSRSL